MDPAEEIAELRRTPAILAKLRQQPGHEARMEALRQWLRHQGSCWVCRRIPRPRWHAFCYDGNQLWERKASF